MSRSAITVSDLDAERIGTLLEQPVYTGLPIVSTSNAKLDRAQMCSPEEMPHDAMTMNNRAKLRNPSDDGVRVCTLVYPARITDSDAQLPVMAPADVALLGLYTDDSIHWKPPGGATTHLGVLKLEYQPEVAGDYPL